MSSFRPVGAGGIKAFLPLDVITQIVKAVSYLNDLAQSILPFMIACSNISSWSRYIFLTTAG